MQIMLPVVDLKPQVRLGETIGLATKFIGALGRRDTYLIQCFEKITILGQLIELKYKLSVREWNVLFTHPHSLIYILPSY